MMCLRHGIKRHGNPLGKPLQKSGQLRRHAEAPCQDRGSEFLLRTISSTVTTTNAAAINAPSGHGNHFCQTPRIINAMHATVISAMSLIFILHHSSDQSTR